MNGYNVSIAKDIVGNLARSLDVVLVGQWFSILFVNNIPW
ncbi:hypothetical protein VCRA2122O339_390002 [Vibrio crassostreae]|nr:hypothetical protein VCHA36P164_260035 [Vibrio chagasii]CAK2952590.1 hypothetical protein VCRA2120E331_340017 [Vibrio crassostreae]CAH7095432.1 hypothetical protein VCHA40P242_260017 [Vibrio chagasii]CAK3456276.1 hypothetical protein VCRA2127O345_340017 [Vibrio crassostreae]CAK3461084.1 hypothetical protein VCRA2120E330_330014 [Vibrio crassostreae]